VSRSVSAAFWQAIAAERTSASFLLLLTIDHPSFGGPTRLVYNNVDITSRGNVYHKYNFKFEPHRENDDHTTAQATVTIEAIDRTVIQAMRSITTRPTVSVEIILASDPDTVEIGPFGYEVVSVSYDAEWIVANLEFVDVLNDKFPADAMTPDTTPGLF
jgi:hypothetical protein